MGRWERRAASGADARLAGRTLHEDGRDGSGGGMRILTLALNTWESFVHNRLIMVVLILSGCIILLMMFPLMGMRAYTNSANQQMMEGAVLDMIAGVMGFVSGLGSLLAAWGAADAYNTELKSGTVLAVMARPVRRWEFLAGKYAGVM